MRILRPEKELEVTPGPEAVADLEALKDASPGPVPAGYFRIPGIHAADEENIDLVNLQAVDVKRDPVLRGNGHVHEAGIIGAHNVCEALDAELPSAPLYLSIMRYCLGSSIEEHAKFLEQHNVHAYTPPGKEPLVTHRFHTATRVDWAYNIIHHPESDVKVSYIPKGTITLQQAMESTPIQVFVGKLIGMENFWALDTLASSLGLTGVITIPYSSNKQIASVHIRCSTEVIGINFDFNSKSQRMYRSVIPR